MIYNLRNTISLIDTNIKHEFTAGQLTTMRDFAKQKAVQKKAKPYARGAFTSGQALSKFSASKSFAEKNLIQDAVFLPTTTALVTSVNGLLTTDTYEFTFRAYDLLVKEVIKRQKNLLIIAVKMIIYPIYF